ncbi:MAG: OmpA family protein [Deltaproteobacteria bacterium]|nr:OmpA family protein [Deltaproteobacteria bacterium]
MKKIIMGVVMVMLAVTVTAGHAQVREGSFSVTPFIGWYTFEGNENLKSDPVYGLRGGYNFTKNLGLEGFFNYVQTESTSLAGNPVIKLSGFGIEGLYHFMPESRLVPFLAVGVGGGHYRGSGVIDDRNKLAVDYGAGLKYFLTENLALRADVRHVNPFNDHYNELLYTIGLNIAFGGAKKALPEVMATRAAEPAAPAKVVKDTDGDGVVDDLDKCPGTPAGVKVDQDGCPLDTDGDGVYDYLDKCPGTPAGVKVDRDGCPLDTDGDGVYDYLDKCPGTPAGVKVDQDGCPPPVVQKAVPQAASAMETAIVEKGRVTLNVEFDTAKSTIRKSSQEEIAKLAAVLKKFTDLKILIEGHTDNVGSAKYNEKLSQQRADAIKKNLVEKYGIDASRLNTKGYGLTKPVASNATKEGRQKNRRVEAAAEYIIKK